MSRPTRSRRLPLKYSEDENIVEAIKSRKARNKIAEVSSDDKETTNEARNVAASKSRSAKGNLLAGKRTVVTQISRSPVLRDRTNLPVEHFKVDILVKKGSDNKTVKKTAKATRQTAKSAVLEVIENEAAGRTKSLRQTKVKNLPLEKENARNLQPKKENTQNVHLVKEKPKDMLAKEKAQNVKETAKKIKATKVAPVSDSEDNSFVIESENATDSRDVPKVLSTRAASKKIEKRVACSKPSLTKQSEKSIENRKRGSLRRSAELGKKGKDIPTTGDTAAGKKFFKSKGLGVAGNEVKIVSGKKIVTSKRRKIVVREKPRLSTSFRLRQTTLSESFAKHARKKNLRPRQAQKDYHEQSTILEKTTTNDKDTTKEPVYKTAKLLDKSDEEGSEIYEFHFDSNDSRERIAKKGKRKVGKGIGKKKTRAKASGSKKTISKPKTAAKNAVEENKVEEPQTKFQADDEAMDTNDGLAMAISDFNLPPMTTEPTEPKKVESQTKKLEPRPESVESLKAKPKVVESKNLTGDMRVNLTSTPQLTNSAKANAGPLRTTNALNVRQSVQYRTMLNHALLNKSLSPITKALENFDPGSPWRPPAIIRQQFSQVKNVVQSTPQVRKCSKMLDNNRNSIDSKAEPAGARMTKIVEKHEGNANVEQASIKPMPQKVLGLAKSPRKFGTEISNVNSIPNASLVLIHENSDKSKLNRGSPRKIATVAPSELANLSETRISDGNDAVDDFDDHADKENSIPVFSSPKKSLKSPKERVAKQSPLRTIGQLKSATKENWEPRPGPSGLQKRSPFSESRALKQSNLNNFLNINQVPTSTRISAAHGIFADAHSTPITDKPVKRVAQEPNVENAFGFDEDSDIDVAPIKTNLFANKKTDGKNNAPVPMRFTPIGRINQHLQPIVAKYKRKNESVERIEEEEKENRESREEKSVSKSDKVDDAANFSNTFDLLSKSDEANDTENVKEIPLFADLEPVHFKKPPRHSYKRKRAVPFNFSEDEEEHDASIGHEKHGTKKRKISKLEKERQKKVEEWANELNHTFEEIDHFDLVVE